jgi:hypothetical protein
MIRVGVLSYGDAVRGGYSAMHEAFATNRLACGVPLRQMAKDYSLSFR